MISRVIHSLTFIIALSAWCAAWAQATGPQLLGVGASLDKMVKPSSEQVTVKSSQDASKAGLVVTISAGGADYPGVTITPADHKTWDLSKYGHIDARITNTGEKTIGVTMRVDDDGNWKDSPWNVMSKSIKPGKTENVVVIFGYSEGKPAHKLNSTAVKRILIFTGKAKADESFRIESIVAGGDTGEKPPVKPQDVRIQPKDGVMLGSGVPIDSARQLDGNHATASAMDGRVIADFPKEAANTIQMVSFKPVEGRWDLRDYLQVQVDVKNTGKVAAEPMVRLSSNGGKTEWAKVESPLAPGAQATLVIPFISSAPWDGSDPRKSGDQLTSDSISRVELAARGADSARQVTIESVHAALPTATELPEWLGKRPPVDGEWTKTFDDEFDGDAVDESKWQIAEETYWETKTRVSKSNVIVGDGVVKLRFNKKRAYQNDDPKHKGVTNYATGRLTTYGTFTQRYGYFEARMKLPTAPGLWPAFWMMPDRGGDDPQWVRQSTEKGAMEFDIMEYLTRWGPHRYNIAMHWDGYGKTHKSIGSDKVYFQPDKDGFITAGLLWTPGSAVFYCNGREVGHWENDRISDVPADLLLTMPMGGWDNSPVDDSKLPDDFVIDYVRVWQRSDLAGDGAAK